MAPAISPSRHIAMETLWQIRLTLNGRMITDIVAAPSQASAAIAAEQKYPGAIVTEVRPLSL